MSEAAHEVKFGLKDEHETQRRACLIGMTIVTPVIGPLSDSDDAESVLRTLNKVADHHNAEHTALQLFMIPWRLSSDSAAAVTRMAEQVRSAAAAHFA